MSSLTNCSCCGRPISTAARSCPACGQPAADPPPSVRAAGAAWRLTQLAILAAVIFGLVVFAFMAWADMHGLLTVQPRPFGQ